MQITEEMLKSCKSELKKRLTINGKTKDYDTYRIPIEYLYYNDKNGRIATYIDEYDDNNGEKLSNLFHSDIKAYNDLFASYIKNSANDKGQSFRKTKEDIRAKKQQVPGVVLSDGRIIDGNRRFTAIRELYQETGDSAFSFFETVVLPVPTEENEHAWKEIKKLELNLQYNTDEKRAYDRIDYLASVYKEVVNPKTKSLDKADYCSASGVKESELKAEINIIYTMLDYLQWRNRPEAFYLLKKEKLDGPIEEIARARAKMNDIEWNDKKDPIYYFITFKNDGDTTREIRKLLQSLKKGTKMFETFQSKLEEDDNGQRLLKALKNRDQKPATSEETIEKKEQMRNAALLIGTSLKYSIYEEDVHNMKNEPFELLKNAKSFLKSLDGWADISLFDFDNDSESEDKSYFFDELNDLIDGIGEIKRLLGIIEDKINAYKTKHGK